MLAKYLVEKITSKFSLKLLELKYFKVDGSLTSEGKLLRDKIHTNTYKTLFNLLMTIFGYVVLSKLNFFPWELLGNGDMNKIYEEGWPNYMFFERPYGFDVFYMMNLTYYLNDLINLVLFNENQSDYYLMVVHHIATIFLFVFSFIGNYSNTGSIIFFIHLIANIFIYFMRITMYSDNFSSCYKSTMGIILTLVWFYTRLIVFAKVLIIVYTQCLFNNWILYYLYPLAILLYVMHIHWIYEILKRLIFLIRTGTAEDVSKIKPS